MYCMQFFLIWQQVVSSLEGLHRKENILINLTIPSPITFSKWGELAGGSLTRSSSSAGCSLSRHPSSLTWAAKAGIGWTVLVRTCFCFHARNHFSCSRYINLQESKSNQRSNSDRWWKGKKLAKKRGTICVQYDAYKSIWPRPYHWVSVWLLVVRLLLGGAPEPLVLLTGLDRGQAHPPLHPGL